MKEAYRQEHSKGYAARENGGNIVCCFVLGKTYDEVSVCR